ncbi:MAG: DNA primase large subunit PriL [Methanoregula sp.]|jgi:DNA primase large subunit|uniref:DNA primase large subunit PriL n=1 Tax=Methanoregula sp. TaxID=2052170 RepID=UPI003D0B1658
MDYSPSAKELSHFPFLKKAQNHVKNSFPPVDVLLAGKKGAFLTELAVKRINQALSSKKTIVAHFQNRDDDEIAGYVLSRILVSCINDKQLYDRLTRYEAERAYYFLNSETGSENEKGWNENTVFDDDNNSRILVYLAQEFRINLTGDRMPLADYVEIVSPLHEARFKLVNRRVENGYVGVRKEELLELLRERIRVILRRDLPYHVPKKICEQLGPAAEQIKKEYQEQMLRQFGTIEESAFPPCMQALITALTAGTNLSHAGRFSLTTFLHTIGMDVSGIAQLYARSPDFDPEKTMYQVEHITGRGGSGTEYNAPACAAMRTTGLCVHRDPLCERVAHPLSYYTIKKKDRTAKGQKKPEEKKEEKKEEKTPAPST